MKNIFITQPTFLPWLGYFDLIDQSSVVVFLDDVQLDKRSWQTRNRVKDKNNEKLISIPVLTKNLRYQKIIDTKIDLENFNLNKIKKVFENNYIKSKFFSIYKEQFFEIFDNSLTEPYLINLNINLINFILKILNLKKNIVFSSKIKTSGIKSQKLINICNKLDFKSLISPAGSESYLNKDISFFRENNIELFIHQYEHPTYQQLGSNFISHLSIVDLIFNHGNSSLEIIREGRKNFKKL
jgi:hypothetical protein